MLCKTDSNTGLQYLRARYYNPANGNFITQDTYEGELTTLISQNRYTYANNDPINMIDPTGHWPDWGGMWNGICETASNVWNGACEAVSTACEWANEHIIQPVVETVKTGCRWVRDNVVKPVCNFVRNVWNRGKQVAGEIISDAVEAGEQVYLTAEQYIAQKRAEIDQQTEYIKAELKKKYCETNERIQQGLSTLGTVIDEKIVKPTVEVVSDVASATCDAVGNAWNTTCDAVGNAWNATCEAAKNVDWGKVAITAGVIAVGVTATVLTGGLAGVAIAAGTGAVLGGGLDLYDQAKSGKE